MSLSIKKFDKFFRSLYRDTRGKPIGPFPWQTRLATQVFDDGWPDCIDLPTASGKTACIDIAVFVLACQAGWATKDRTVGRRIFFTVNRRVIVDEAFERAKTLAEKLLDAKDGILKDVADALHEISGDKKAPPLDVAEIRGGIYRDRAWARSITQPIVVCTTADQLGSRLLFRGYGVSASSAPIHAALCGCDSLVLLDEAHVTRAFSQTLQLLKRYQAQHTTAPQIHFVQMTATPAGKVKKPFALDAADRAHPLLKVRHTASKPATLIKLDKKKPIAGQIVSCALAALSDSRKAVGIIVNRVQTAREIERLIREDTDKRAKEDETFKAEVHLVIGPMRLVDRDDLQKKLREFVGPDRPDLFPADANPVFVIATQCLEVGADYDFDALITECASVDALRQRFGRLNRKGRPIETAAAIVTNDESIKGDDPIYGDAIKHTWEWLWSKRDENDQVDFAIARFKRLWKEVEEERAIYLDDNCSKPLLSPTQNAAVLLPAHLDALCQTNPQPVPSPDVSFFIHGPQRDMAEVNVCWRADLGEVDEFLPDIVRLLPPTSPECMTVPLVAMKRWMGERYKTDADADIPTRTLEVDDKHGRSDGTRSARVVVWRYGRKPGEDGEKKRRLVGFVTNDPHVLKSGDTVVLPIEYQNWSKLGHVPESSPREYHKREDESPEDHAERCLRLDRAVDVAERATREAKRRVMVRIHSAFEGVDQLRGLTDPELRTALIERGIIPPTWNAKPVARIERHSYPGSDQDNPDAPFDEVIVFKRLLESSNSLVMPPDDEDDGEDNLSERDRIITLDKHNGNVVTRLTPAVGKLHLNGLGSTICTSGPLHDLGKADIRFNAMLAGVTPYEAMLRPLLGKGDSRRLTAAEKAANRIRALLPRRFRHEMLSMQLVEHRYDELVSDANVDIDLLLHLIAAHHGYARPFAPVVIDDAEDETRSIEVNGVEITPEERSSWIPSHRLNSGVAERFWKLTREHGWWGLAWLESILRLADQQASAAEQEGIFNE